MLLESDAASQELKELLIRSSYVQTKDSYIPHFFAYSFTKAPALEDIKFAAEWVAEWAGTKSEEITSPVSEVDNEFGSYQLAAETARTAVTSAYAASGYKSVNAFLTAARSQGPIDHNVARYLLAQPPLPLTPHGLRSSSIQKLRKLTYFFNNLNLPPAEGVVGKAVETPKAKRNLAREVAAVKVLRKDRNATPQSLMEKVPGLTFAEAKKLIGFRNSNLTVSPSDPYTITPTSHSFVSPATSTSSTTESRSASSVR